MSPDPFTSLQQAAERLAGRRRSPTWLETDDFAGFSTLDAVIAAVRDDASPNSASDQAVRALARAGLVDREALTVLLHALAPELRRRIWRGTTDEYLNDLIGDLALVVFDAIDRGDLDHCDRLAHRLANRAHNRANKRANHVRTRGTRDQYEIEPLPPERLARYERIGTDDVADLAVARADLGRFAAAVSDALDAGELSLAAWASFRQDRLARSIGLLPQPMTPQERSAAYRSAVRVRRYAVECLAA